MRQSSNDYETAFSKITVFDIQAITEVIFSVCFKRRKELKLLLKHNLSHLMLRELEHPHRNYMLSYHIGGFWNILNLRLTRARKNRLLKWQILSKR
jgi:hypothetical protein